MRRFRLRRCRRSTERRFGERPQGRFGDFDLRFACRDGVIYGQTKTGRHNQESVDVTLTGQYSMSSAVAPELNMMSANEMLDYIGAAVAVRLSGDALTDS